MGPHQPRLDLFSHQTRTGLSFPKRNNTCYLILLLVDKYDGFVWVYFLKLTGCMHMPYFVNMYTSPKEIKINVAWNRSEPFGVNHSFRVDDLVFEKGCPCWWKMNGSWVSNESTCFETTCNEWDPHLPNRLTGHASILNSGYQKDTYRCRELYMCSSRQSDDLTKWTKWLWVKIMNPKNRIMPTRHDHLLTP